MADNPPVSLDDARMAARAAHLRYVGDDKPGISRKPDGKGSFVYADAAGKGIADPETLSRIRKLGIPPAWREVWICPLENGHLQATGRDARGRKQYRYHARWREIRDAAKYDRMLAFGAALPAIRARVDADLGRHGMPREKVLATLVYLLEKTCIRVGNDEYAHSNQSYGLTTMQEQHVAIKGSTLRFRFRGKSGKDHDVALHDARVARIVRQSLDLPGQELFHYQDHDGAIHHIHSHDVNDYLREAAGGQEFTAKDFRTWAGTIFCALTLAEGEAATSEARGKRIVAEAIKRVSQHLGNTPAICRKCYVHPAVISAFQAGAMVLERALPGKAHAAHGGTALSADEAAVLKFLERAGQ